MENGEGYRILGDDERLLETDERKYSHLDKTAWKHISVMSGWYRYATVKELRNAFKMWNNVVIRRKVDVVEELPQPFTQEELTASYKSIPIADLPPVMPANPVFEHVTLTFWLCWDHKGQEQGRWHVDQPKVWSNAVNTGITMEVPAGGAK